MALALALFAIYVGTALAGSFLSANRDTGAVLGVLGYYTLVVGGPAVVAYQVRRAGKPRCVVICRAALTCLAAHLLFLPFLAALMM